MSIYKGTKDIVLEWVIAYKKLNGKNPSYTEYRLHTERLWGIEDSRKIRNNYLIKYFNPKYEHCCFVRTKDNYSYTIDVLKKDKK